MAKSDSRYACKECGTQYVKWMGKCGSCNQFGTLEEIASNSVAASNSAGLKSSMSAKKVTHPAQRIRDVKSSVGKTPRQKMGIPELDRILGGGYVPGQAILLAAEPGFGKSTLLLHAADAMSKDGKTVLYVSGEESVEQLGVRAQRIGVDADSLLVAAETDIGMVLGHINETNPDFIIVDSVQTISSSEMDGRAGGVSQIMEVATILTRLTKTIKAGLVIVGQVTKNNDIGGPRTLEHLVDTSVFGEGDKHSGLRILRIVKNRFGPADEIAVFEQTETGMREVTDPSGLFADRNRQQPIPGVCTTVTMEGRRPLLAEIQALATHTNAPNPRRGVSGLQQSRTAMLTAVAEKYGKIKLYDKDVFLATVAGMNISEPGADLAVIIAVVSAAKDVNVPVDVAAVGEVTLSGDVRKVPDMRQRIAEAARLGYRRVFVPQESPKVEGIVNIHVSNVYDALRALHQTQT